MGNVEQAKKWTISAAIAALGGGIAGAFSAMWDPKKYSILHDLGSGKLWKFFAMGAALTFGGMLLKSPLGQKVMGAVKQSQQDLEQSQVDLKQAKQSIAQAEGRIGNVQGSIAPDETKTTPPPAKP